MRVVFTGLCLHALQKVREKTVVLQFQQPAPNEPMLAKKAVKLHFTQCTLKHYLRDQLHNALFYKQGSCEGNCSFYREVRVLRKGRARRQPLSICSQFCAESWELAACIFISYLWPLIYKILTRSSLRNFSSTL